MTWDADSMSALMQRLRAHRGDFTDVVAPTVNQPAGRLGWPWLRYSERD